MIKKCPNCESKNISLITTKCSNDNLFGLLTINPKDKTINQDELLKINTYVCNDCHFISLFAPFEKQNDNQ